ncbi:major facilitator superfamily domain-containing protein [Aspergillus germanicus]
MENLPLQHVPDNVPGTILLVNLTDGSHTHAQRGEIVLQPQPSTDLTDPLNRSRGWKSLNIGMVIGDLNLGTGLMQIMQGWCNLIWQPIAMTYGRRLVYVLTVVLSIGPVVWVPLGHGAGQWYAHRIILGVLCSSVEALPELSVQDLFFAHERGHYIALYAFVLFGSNFIAPFVAGFIADGAGWEWVMYFATIFLAVCSVIIFFFLEETIYFRKATESVEVVYAADAAKKDDASEHNDQPATSASGCHGTEAGTATPRKPRLQKLALVTKLPSRPTHNQMAWQVWQSLTIPIFFPNILWAGLLYGPYNSRPTMVGVAYLSPFVFGGAASIWAGKLADHLAIKLAERNGGVREAEHRLWILSVSALRASGGMLMWGVGASQEAHYMVLIIGIGITTFDVVCASAISLAYATDCFEAMAGESFVSIMIIRNTIGFAFSYAITPWIDAMGLRGCFISVSLISFFCTYTFLAVIFWGKSWRRLSAKRY